MICANILHESLMSRNHFVKAKLLILLFVLFVLLVLPVLFVFVRFTCLFLLVLSLVLSVKAVSRAKPFKSMYS